MINRTVKRKTIGLSKEAFMYLQDRCRYERCGDHLSEKFKERLEKSFDQFAYKGYKEYYDGDLGGAVNGRWTSWSCDQVKKMLDESGLDYIEGEEKESIEIGL